MKMRICLWITSLSSLAFLAGCGGGGESTTLQPQTTPGGLTNPVAVHANADGSIATAISAETNAPGAKITIAAGTVLRDAAGNPLSGNFDLGAASFTGTNGLPQGSATAVDDSGKILDLLGAGIELDLKNATVSVKQLSKPMTVNLKPVSAFTADPYVYSYDGAKWVAEDQDKATPAIDPAVKKTDGTVDMKVDHFSTWIIASFKAVPPVTTVTSKSVTGSTVALISIGSLVGKKAAATASSSMLKNALVNILSYDKNNVKIDNITVSSGDAGTFNSQIKLSEPGYVVLTVKKDGFSDFSKRIDFATANDINLKTELSAVTTAVATPTNAVVKSSSGRPVNASVFSFGVVRYGNGVKKALGGSAFKAAKAAGGTTTELEIAIPADMFSANGINTLVGKLSTFDSSSPQDAKSFPGVYTGRDAAGTQGKLVSLAFDYINITDDQGKNLGDIVKSLKKAGKISKAAASTPTTVTRWIPTGSCENLFLKDSSTADGHQVPVWTLDPYSGLWDYLGEGTVSQQDLDGTYKTVLNPNKTACADPGYYLNIEVANENFIKNWWNLDHIVFDEPVRLCVSGSIKDDKGAAIAGSYLSLYDATGKQSLEYSYGSSTDSGTFKLETVLLNKDDTNRSATLQYYDPLSYVYTEKTVTLGLSPDCGSADIVVVKPTSCTVTGTVKDALGSPLASSYVYIYSSSPYFYRYVTTGNDGSFSADVSCEKDLNVYVGNNWNNPYAIFNVSGATADFGNSEKTDDGSAVGLNDIALSNEPPNVVAYLSSSTIKVGGGTAIDLYAYDYDGNYPITYAVKSDGVALPGAGGAVASGEYYKSVPVTGLAAGTHKLKLEARDSLGATSTYDLGTLQVNEPDVNRPPIISYTYSDKYALETKDKGQTVTFYAYAYDLDGDNLTFAWKVNDSDIAATTQYQYSTASFTIPTSAVEGSLFTVKLVVTDGAASTSTSFDLQMAGTAGGTIIIQ